MLGSLMTTIGLAEARTNFAEVSAEVNKTGMPITVLKDNVPWVVIAPAAPAPTDVAADFMEEYADVFEELAK